VKIDKLFPSKYLKAEDIGNREVPVTIQKVSVEMIKSREGSEEKAVLRFDGKTKGLILNKTNATKISAIAKSKETKDWSGVEIVLYSTLVSFGSDEVPAIRVKAPSGNGSAETSDAETEAGADGDESMASDDIPF
jgi:hypothetical protein